MAASAVVTQSADATTLTFTDTSSDIGTVTGRSLVISDSDGIVLTTIDMGASVTTTYTITKDVYLSFVLTITLSAGSPLTVSVNYMSKQFYNLAQRDATLNGCGCNGDNDLCTNQTKAREAINAAIQSFNVGDGVSCQFKLDAANLYIS